MKGHIYILTHPDKSGMVKIGSSMTSVEQRIRELDARSGLKGRYVIYYSIIVSDFKVIEKQVHQKLSPYRVALLKEFFLVEPFKAREILEAVLKTLKPGIGFERRLKPRGVRAKKRPNYFAGVQQKCGFQVAQETGAVLNSVQQLGELIGQHRECKGINQRDLVHLSGSDLKTIIQLEQGSRMVPLGHLFKVIDALELKLSIAGRFINSD